MLMLLLLLLLCVCIGLPWVPDRGNLLATRNERVPRVVLCVCVCVCVCLLVFVCALKYLYIDIENADDLAQSSKQMF